MPYIPKKSRKPFEFPIEELIELINDEAQLNYVITRLVWGFLKNNTINYSTYNKLVGVLECAKLELYRRLIAGYEDQKIIDNGDIDL